MNPLLYFLCMLKSTEWNPCFYSPSLTATRDDADGGKVIRFGDRDASDTRERPSGVIFVPPLPYEECPKYAYVCFDDAYVDAGNPRSLTVEQYEKVVKSNAKKSASKTTSDSATA